MKLTNPTDEQLNKAFAEKVAGWSPAITDKSCCYDGDGNHCYWSDVPPFTQSADAVLPWLEKFDTEINYPCWRDIKGKPNHRVKFWHVSITNPDGSSERNANAQSFPRAAAIALLRAHGVEVEFSP